MNRVGIYETSSHPHDKIWEHERREKRPYGHNQCIGCYRIGDRKEKEVRATEAKREANDHFFKRMESERELQHKDRNEQLLHQDFSGFWKEIPWICKQDIRRGSEMETV